MLAVCKVRVQVPTMAAASVDAIEQSQKVVVFFRHAQI
jgi:hypothetical protein